MTTNGPPNLLSAVTGSCTCRLVEPGAVLFEEGQPCRGLYLLHSAKIRLVKRSPGGDFEIQPDIGKGTVLGISDLLAKRPHPVTALVVERGEVGFISLEALNPFFARRVEALAAAIRTNLEARIQLSSLVADALAAALETRESSSSQTMAS